MNILKNINKQVKIIDKLKTQGGRNRKLKIVVPSKVTIIVIRTHIKLSTFNNSYITLALKIYISSK